MSDFYEQSLSVLTFRPRTGQYIVLLPLDFNTTHRQTTWWPKQAIVLYSPPDLFHTHNKGSNVSQDTGTVQCVARKQQRPNRVEMKVSRTLRTKRMKQAVRRQETYENSHWRSDTEESVRTGLRWRGRWREGGGWVQNLRRGGWKGWVRFCLGSSWVVMV